MSLQEKTRALALMLASQLEASEAELHFSPQQGGAGGQLDIYLYDGQESAFVATVNFTNTNTAFLTADNLRGIHESKT